MKKRSLGGKVGCSALQGKDNAISDVERGNDAFVPFVFPRFQYLLMNRNLRFITCPPLPLAYIMSNTTVMWL